MSNSSINIQTTQFKGNNLGSGTTIYDSVNPFNTLNFKSLVGAGAIEVVSGTSELIISASTASGEANTGTNVGTGIGIYKDNLGTVLRFKRLLPSGSVGITTSGDDIIISAGTEANAAGNITEIQYNNSSGNTLGANSGFTFVEATQSFTLGNRSASVEGKYSSTQGNSNVAIGDYSHAGGQSSIACGYASFSQGKNNTALSDNSAIVGGYQNNIAVGNTNAAIIGGSNIDLTGTSYIDTTGVGKLALITSPTNNTTTDQVLVRNTSTGIIEYISKASIGATDIYVSGGTLDGSAQLALARSEGQPDVNIDLSALSGGTTDIYVSGATLNVTTLELARSEGQPDVTVDLASINTNDGVVSGGTLDGSAQLALARTEGLGDVNIDLSALSGGTGGTTNPAGANTEIQFNNAGLFGANTGFTFITASQSFTLGKRLGVVEGDYSVGMGLDTCALGNFSQAFGCLTKACGHGSHAIGRQSEACGTASHSEGFFSIAVGNYSHAEGNQTCALGASSHTEGESTFAQSTSSHAEGNQTYAFGSHSHTEGYKTRTTPAAPSSHAEGRYTCAGNDGVHVGGFGYDGNYYIYACGNGAFNHSYNTNSQTSGHGALANWSAILGGRNHNIEIGNSGATIIGGNNIKLTGATYVNTTAVSNLAIMNTPSAGGANDLLTWETGSTGIGTVKKVTQASVSDRRLKTIIQPIQNPLEGIIALNGYEYEFNEKMQPKAMVGKKRYGLLAQEVEERFPLVVNNNLQFDDGLYKTVEYRELVPVLVEAIKELEGRIKILENK